MKRRPSRLAALVVVFVPLTAMPLACALLDPFPDLAAYSRRTEDGPTDEDAANDAGTGCKVGTTRECGFEVCTGTEQCLPDGSWTSCNARRATHEVCETDADESCDGVGTCTGEGRWARSFGDSRAQQVNAIATDDNGNVYAVGFFDGNLFLNEPDGGTVPNGGNDLARDAFLLKLSRSGALLWARNVPDSTLTAAAFAARAKEVVVGGVLHGSTSIPGCGPLAYAGGGDVLIARFDLDGNCIKAARYGDETIQSLTGVAVDPVNEDVLAVGTFSGNLAFGGGTDAGTDFTSLSPQSGYFVRTDRATLLGRNGKTFSANRPEVTGVAVNSQQQAVIVGSFMTYLEQRDAKGARDGFVMKFHPSGERYDLDTFGAVGGSTSPTVIAVDRKINGAEDSVVVAGHLTGLLELPGGSVLETPSTHGGMFIVRIPTAYRATAWSGRWYGDEGLERAYAIATDLEGNVVIAGEVHGHANLGGGAFDASPDLSFDAFVAKYDPLFNHRWSHVFGGAGQQASFAVATDPLGNVFVGGSFSGAIDFGDAGKPLHAGEATDAFVLRRRP